MVASFVLHSGQRLAKPGLPGLSSNSSPQTLQVLIGYPIPLYDTTLPVWSGHSRLLAFDVSLASRALPRSRTSRTSLSSRLCPSHHQTPPPVRRFVIPHHTLRLF